MANDEQQRRDVKARDTDSSRTMTPGNHDEPAGKPEQDSKNARPGKPAVDPYLVYFKRGDPECPFYFPLWKKWMIVIVIALQILWVAGIGASWSPANHYMAVDVGVSDTVARVAQAMYLVGFSLGPVLLTPLSEDYGRKPVFTASLALLYILHIPIALAKNIETLIICRFLAGFVASPIFNSCCCIPDLWRSTDEFVAGFALNIWALSAEIIVIAPIWGAYITININWRWLWGITALVGIASTVVFVLLVPETRHTVLLARRAKKLNKKLGENKHYALGAIAEKRTLSNVLRETLYRPVFMLLTEPIVNLFALYDGLNYGIIYLAIEAVPIVYGQHGFEDPGVEFMFLSILVGYLIGIALFPVQWRANQKLNKKSGGQVIPEGKLYWGFLAGFLFPISLYLFAWLSLPRIFWFVSLIPLALFGIASHILFLMVSDYTVDSYGHLASSAVTGQSFARELMSAGLIIVGHAYYTNLGPQIATTILAAIATALGVLPFLFFKYGPKIRERSHYSQEIKKAAKEDEERAMLEESTPQSA